MGRMWDSSRGVVSPTPGRYEISLGLEDVQPIFLWAVVEGDLGIVMCGC